MQKGYDINEARKCMDMYLTIKDGNKGLWEISEDLDAYRVIIDKDDDDNYYVIIQGTDPTKPKDLVVDIEVFIKREFPFPIKTTLDPRISGGIKDEFMALVNRIRVFLNNLPNGTNLYITGHSQGAAVCGVFHLWLATFVPDKFNIKTYAFAPPSIGNQHFATLVDQAPTFGLYRVINPRDLIPHAYADILEVISEGIPTTVPFFLKVIFYAIHKILNFLGRDFTHVGETIILENDITETCDTSFIGRLFKYSCEVGNQHIATHYKQLLDQ